MWKWKEEGAAPAAESSSVPRGTPASVAGSQTLNPQATPKEVGSVQTAKPLEAPLPSVAHIGKSVIVRGELSGSEDLYLDGEIEGSIELRGHNLTVGPNGRVRANIQAQGVIVHGKVEGKVHGSERVELRKSAVLVGDIVTHRIVIEDGAYLKGSIDIEKKGPEPATPEPKREAVTAAPAAGGQTSLLEVNK